MGLKQTFSYSSYNAYSTYSTHREKTSEGYFMADIQLKKLKRDQLLELLLEQTKRADALEQQLKEKDEQLKSKEILLEESGNIAEAALRLNNIFENAQRTADQYIESIMLLQQRLQDRADKEANKL